ncbi:MAG: hypothetical protein ACO4AI_05865 [Prochlorothrix sp.]|nr:hypothetical protein [Prochlorothrix sp.]
MQFRAIGLLRGRYVKSEDLMNRGQLVLSDGCQVDAVVLGRVISLVKNHIDLDSEHLWVVYPRTDDRTCQLQVQVVGVWEPETLQSRPTILESNDDGGLRAVPPKSPVVSSQDLPDGYFSIRGEVVYQSAEKEQLAVKIKQVSRKDPKKSRAFKLQLQGVVEDKALHQFWDFRVRRQGDMLTIEEAEFVAKMPPKRKNKKKKKKQRRPRPLSGPQGVLPNGEKRPVGKPVPRDRAAVGYNANPAAAPGTADGLPAGLNPGNSLTASGSEPQQSIAGPEQA